MVESNRSQGRAILVNLLVSALAGGLALHRSASFRSLNIEPRNLRFKCPDRLLHPVDRILLKTDDEALMGAWDLYKQRSDVALSFTDSTIAFLAKKHFVSDIFSYDAHFGALGFHVLNRL